MPARQRATEAFVRAFRRVSPGCDSESPGYVRHLADDLAPGITPDLFAGDFGTGAGHELELKARAAYSSATLAVNAFARWKAEPDTFPLLSGVGTIRFEARCGTGPGGTPPHLDLLAAAPGAVLGVESKCLEYFSAHAPEFAAAYDSLNE